MRYSHGGPGVFRQQTCFLRVLGSRPICSAPSRSACSVPAACRRSGEVSPCIDDSDPSNSVYGFHDTMCTRAAPASPAAALINFVREDFGYCPDNGMSLCVRTLSACCLPLQRQTLPLCRHGDHRKRPASCNRGHKGGYYAVTIVRQHLW